MREERGRTQLAILIPIGRREEGDRETGALKAEPSSFSHKSKKDLVGLPLSRKGKKRKERRNCDRLRPFQS